MNSDSQVEYLFVTGGAGFIGSNFVNYIYEKYGSEYHVINYDKLTYAGNVNHVDERIRQSNNYTFVQGDITDANNISRVFKQYDIKKVIHFAAESHVCNSIEDPLLFIQTNIIGTFQMLECARKYWMDDNFKAKQGYENARFLHVSTDEVYGSLGPTGLFSETSRYLPNSPYSASKASSDLFVRSYYHTYGLNVVTTNCSNNYGPYQHTEKLIPKMIEACIFSKPITIHGNGMNIRDWLYVKDHCSAIDAVFHKGNAGESYNVGANTEKSNMEIINIICEFMDQVLAREINNSCKNQIIYVKDRPGNDARYGIDSSKLEKELEWTCVNNFEENLKKTILYYIDINNIKSQIPLSIYKNQLESLSQ